MLTQYDIEHLPLDQIMEAYEISLISNGQLNAVRREKEPYPAWGATAWKPRRESAYGNTPREAVMAVVKKLT